MKKKALKVINMILGSAIIATGAFGCKAKKAAVEEKVKTEPATEEAVEEVEPTPSQEVICLYGVPPEFYKPDPRPMLKYGVPNPNGGMSTGPEKTK